MDSKNQNARNRAILYILLGLVVFLYALGFIRVSGGGQPILLG